MKIKEVMSYNPVTILNTSTVQKAALVMQQMKIDSVPIVDYDNSVVGMCTVFDVLDAVKNSKPSLMLVSEIIHSKYPTLHPEDDVDLIINMKGTNIPVTEQDNRIIGLVEKEEVLKKIYFKNSSEYHLALMDSINSGLIVVDNNLNVTFFNREAKKFLEMEGTSHNDINIHRILPENQLNSLFSTKMTTIQEIDGKQFMISQSPVYTKENVIGATILFYELADVINQFNQKEEKLKSSEILNTMMNVIYDGVIVIDEYGDIVTISKDYAKFLGTDFDQIIGKHITEVEENTRLHHILESGKAEIAELQNIKGDNFIASRYPIFNNGKMVGAIGILLFRNLSDIEGFKKEVTKLEERLAIYKEKLLKIYKANYFFDDIIGDSEQLKKFKALAMKNALENMNVLIRGEEGTEKVIFAHAIHNASIRSTRPFLKLDCRILTESDIEGIIDELKVTKGGTIFLEEIDQLPLFFQKKLLNVVIYAESFSSCVIATASKDIEALIKKGDFLQDLYSQLKMMIEIPPLRERKEDIYQLTHYFVEKLAAHYEKGTISIPNRVIEKLQDYHWPENLKELERMLDKVVLNLKKDETMSIKHLPVFTVTGAIVPVKENEEVISLEDAMRRAEQLAIENALKMCKGNKTKAAKLLQVSRSSLYEKMAKFNLSDGN